MQDLPRAVRHLHKGLARARVSARPAISHSAIKGGLNAWRKFEPDKFTDDEVEQFKREWRAAHPAIVKFWHDIDRAAVLAVRERGQIVRCGRIDLKYIGAFLQLKLPWGRKISYPQPRIIEDKRHKHRVVFADNAAGQFVDCRHGQGAYGGLWTENIVSGIARDLLAEAMLRIEAAGYPIVLHVHDEIVCEVPIGFGSTEEFTHLDDAQAGLGAGAADRSQCLDRAALLQMKGEMPSVPADTRAANCNCNANNRRHPWCC